MLLTDNIDAMLDVFFASWRQMMNTSEHGSLQMLQTLWLLNSLDSRLAHHFL